MIELAWLPAGRDGEPEHQAEVIDGHLVCSRGWRICRPGEVMGDGRSAGLTQESPGGEGGIYRER